jgi:hypothetical protein
MATLIAAKGERSSTVATSPLRSLRGFERFYEKVVTVKADVAALLTFLCFVAFATFPQKSLR